MKSFGNFLLSRPTLIPVVLSNLVKSLEAGIIELRKADEQANIEHEAEITSDARAV